MQKGNICLVIIIIIFIGVKANCQNNISKKILYGDTSKFNSIESVLNIPELKGKVVYIDLWGTRCGPCIEEFKNIKSLKEHYKNKSVAFLYLKSPYDFDDSKEWQEMVNRFNLDGVNVSMSINLYVNGFWERFKTKYPENRLYGIPTYLIVNKKGQIINFDAPRRFLKKEKMFHLLLRIMLIKTSLDERQLPGFASISFQTVKEDLMQQ